MKKLLIAPDASQDLRDIIDYFSDIDIEAGEKFIELFNTKLRQIAQFPNIGRRYDFSISLRGVLLNNYVILYRPIDGGVEIVRVVSGYRDLDRLFNDSY